MKMIVIYDDTNEKSEVIRDIIGNKGFADVVVKKQKLESYYQEKIGKVYSQLQWITVRSVFELHEMREKTELFSDEQARVLHCFSNYLIADEKKAFLAFEKIFYIDGNYKVLSGRNTAALMFHNTASYGKYLDFVCSGCTTAAAAGRFEDTFEIEGLVDIGVVGNFIQCITGNFESRFFNSLQGDEYTLVKSSTNKKKIKSEYMYYHLLPEDMRIWFVMPFNYQEDSQKASYRMERLHMADLAIKWVHGSFDVEEFEELLDRFFYFFKSRHSRPVTPLEYMEQSRKLYEEKVEERIESLKQLKEYRKIKKMMGGGNRHQNIEQLAEEYFKLKERIEMGKKYPAVSVIGHGDPCFANALYNRSTKTLKFIDPKGALTEEELWTNPYYDIAKLSHSVCGRYDFFNNGLFRIEVNEAFAYELHIDFDHTKYEEIFRRKLELNGYDYLTVRIYEASLFLSMLPLHMDNPYKVFGFILNVENILEEVEKYASK